MSSIFVKVVDKTVSDKQLSVELTKIQPVKIEGESAEQIVKNLETLLDRKDSLKITAGGRIFSNEMVLMEEIFDAFETQNINDQRYGVLLSNSAKLTRAKRFRNFLPQRRKHRSQKTLTVITLRILARFSFCY